MAMTISRHGETTAIRCSWWRSDLVRYSVQAFMTRGVLIDAGFAGVAADMARLIAETTPAGVIITHHHEDHAGNAELLAARGIPLQIAADTERALRTPHRIRFYRRFTWQPAPLLRSPVDPFAHDALQVIPTPGHSSDHHAVWDAERRTLYAGDLYLGVKVRVAHEDEDPFALLASLHRAIALEPAHMFCAHRGYVSDATSALRAKAAWLSDAIGEVQRGAERGESMDEIRRRIFGRRPLTHYFSGGEYSPDNFVRAVIGRHRARSRLDATEGGG